MESQNDQIGLHTDIGLLLREIRGLRNDLVANTAAMQILTEVVRTITNVQLRQQNRSPED